MDSNGAPSVLELAVLQWMEECASVLLPPCRSLYVNLACLAHTTLSTVPEVQTVALLMEG